MYRYTVYKQQEFSAAHYLREYHGQCETLHGHNYIVRIYASANELDGEGMVIDFALLKGALKQVIDRFDHQNLNDVAPFLKTNPTSERLAEHICEEVGRQLDDERVRITRCDVWETAANCASYLRPAVG
jgi:6-pyruvoyltetrahydropterin/6-carboxytetrahydropterin synthase